MLCLCLSLYCIMQVGTFIRLRELPDCLVFFILVSCILASFIGAYALLSPAYRKSVVEMKQAQENRATEIIADEERIKQIIKGIDLPEDFPDDYRTGMMMIAYRDETGNGVELANPEFVVR